MANNVEKFLIDFVFKDKTVVNDLKKIVKLQENIEKTSQKSARAEKIRSQKSRRNRQSEIDQLKDKKRLLRDQMRLARDIGIDIKGYKTTLAQAKKISTVDRRRKELQDEISKARFKSQEAARKTAEWERKQNQLARERSAIEKASNRRKNLMVGFETSKSFKSLRDMSPARAADFYRRAQEALNKETHEGVRAFRRLKSEMADTERQLRRNRARTVDLKTAQRGLTDSTRNMIRAYASVFALFEGVTAINRVGQDFEGMRATMLASSGGAKQAAKDLAFIRDEAVRLGVDLRSSADAFVKLQFAAKDSMTNEQTRELFTGFSEFATALQIDKFRYEKGLTALQQMLNKTTIMSEELKQQLSEQVPGSIQVFARALNVSTKELFEMMERGELLASDVLPKVAAEFARTARQGGALEAALNTARIQQKRFFTGAQEASDIIFQAGFGEGIADMFFTFTQSLADSESGLKGLGKTFKLVFDSIALVVKAVTPILNHAFSVIGVFAETINKLFVNDIGMIVGGIGLFAAALWRVKSVVKLLNLSFTSLFAKIYPIYFLIKEFIALMSKDVIGDIELALGRDVSISDLGSNKVVKQREAAKRGFDVLNQGFTGGLGQQAANQASSERGTVIQRQENNFNIKTDNPQEMREELDRWWNDKALQGAVNGGG